MQYFSIVGIVATAAALGVAGAAAGIGFVRATAWLTQTVGDFSAADSTVRIFAPMAAGAASAWIAWRIKGHFRGLADIALEARTDDGRRDWKADIGSSLAALIALGGGASVGQYGPVGHLGGIIGRAATGVLGRGIGQSCGVAAAIAAVFNAPVTGLIFAHEVVLRHYSLRAFTPVAVSAVVGYCAAANFFGERAFLRLGDMAAHITPKLVLLFCLQGLIFGTIAAAYVRLIFFLSAAGKKMPLTGRLVSAGLATGMLSLIAPQILGGGRELLESSMLDFAGGWQAAAMIGGVKFIATVLCLGLGFAGGIVSPTLVIGAMFGLLFGHVLTEWGWWQVPLFVPAICGMMALTGPVIGAPLAGVLFVLELSGSYSVTVVAVLAVAVATMTAARLGGGSYYERQLRERGLLLTQSGEQWALASSTVSQLARREFAWLCHAQTPTVGAAIAKMTDNNIGEAFVVDDNHRYLGVLRLSVAIRAAANDDLMTAMDKDASTLRESDTLASAMDKMAGNERMAVVNDEDKLSGEVRAGDLLAAHKTAVDKRHREETAT